MSETVIQFLTSQGPAIAILGGGGYVLIRYFMSVLDKKDAQNQANLDRYIILSEKNMEVMGKFGASLDNLHPKLNDIHNDIKEIAKRQV